MSRRVCVLGAGNSAHTVAGLAARLPDWEVHVYAPRKDRAELWRAGIGRGGIDVCYGADDDHLVVHGVPDRVSKHAEEVVPGCEVLVLCLPAEAYDENVQAAAPYVDPGAMIGTICAANGFDWCVDAAMAAVGRAPDSYGVFSLQNLPWACRVSDYGKAIDAMGTKPFMEITARPGDRVGQIGADMGDLIRVPCPEEAGGFLGFGLSNIAQIIHPCVMYGNFRDWDGETPYERVPLFYEEMSDFTADTMTAVSDEIAALRANLEERVPGLDLSVVRHILPWCLRAYGKYIVDATNLRTRFATNKAYVGLTCPHREVDGGFVPDFGTRYITEDVPFNLLAVRGVAELAGVETPTILRVLEWAQGVMGKQYLVDGEVRGRDIDRSFAPQRFGFTTLEEIPELAALLARA